LAYNLEGKSDGEIRQHAKEQILALKTKRDELPTIEAQKKTQLDAFDAAVRREHEKEARLILDSQLLGLASAKNKENLTDHPNFNKGHMGKTQFQIEYGKDGKVSSISILPREGHSEERMDLVLGHALRDYLFYGKGFNFFEHDEKVIDLALQILKEQGCKDVTVVARDGAGHPTTTALSDYASVEAVKKGLEVPTHITPRTEKMLQEAEKREEQAYQQVRQRPPR
jgi:hypothetical protein